MKNPPVVGGVITTTNTLQEDFYPVDYLPDYCNLHEIFSNLLLGVVIPNLFLRKY